MITGNISVAFAALSSGGVLNMTVIADPLRCPDLSDIVDAVQRELDDLTNIQVPTDRAHLNVHRTVQQGPIEV